SAAGAGASAELSERSSEGRHTCARHRHHYAPITHRLYRWNYFWRSTRITYRALDFVARYDWDAGAWITDFTERLLGAVGASLVRSNRSRHVVRRYHGYAL